MTIENKYGRRSKSLKKLRMDLLNGPSTKESEAWILTDSEINFLRNHRLLAGEGGPSNYHHIK